MLGGETIRTASPGWTTGTSTGEEASSCSGEHHNPLRDGGSTGLLGNKSASASPTLSPKPSVIASWVSATMVSAPSRRLVASSCSSWLRPSASTTSWAWSSVSEEAGSEVTVWMMTPSLEQRPSV